MLIKVDWNSKKSLKEAVAPKLNDNFWKWFGNSKCVDEQGKPLVFYHGTKSNFTNFDMNKAGENYGGYSAYGKGMCFTTDESFARRWGNKAYGLNKTNVMAVYLSIQNPYRYSPFNSNSTCNHKKISVEEMIEQGYDGILDFTNSPQCFEAVAFYPNQIKSVDNNGNWSLTSDNINEWWSGGVNWQNDRDGLGGVGATMDCHLFFFMFPDQFLNLCPKFSYGDEKFFNQYVADRKPIGIPFLWCEVDEKNKTLKVFDHEGRHRVKAIRSYAASRGKSQPDIPVAIIYNKDKYRLPVDLTELRKNWKIVGQNGDMSYNIGMFRVQNNLDNQRVGVDNLYESQEPNLNQNFWNWFKGSKTVDEQGNPLIFYHGTKQPNITNFKAKYDDGLVFFAYNEEFAKEWASNAPLTPEQEQGVRDFKGSDDLANYRKEVMDRYKRDYGDNWADDEDIRKAAKWEIKEYEKQKYKQMGIEENVIPVYIRATKIFNPARDYSKVIKEISDHWDLDLKSDYKQEYDEAKVEYDKVNNVINKWFEEHKEYRNDSAMEPEFRKREDILTNALNKFNEVKKKIETRNNHLKRIMSGAWIYFENPETINKIWKLGYDAIELAEHDGEISTLAVREGTNQVKSIFNYGNWGSDTNIFENF